MGATNEDIFCRSLESLYDDSCRNLFVCWTSTKRIRLNPSVELYETELYLENSKIPDVHINPRMVIPGKYVEDIRDRFFLLNHEHYEILKILRYSWLLAGAAKITKTKIYFVVKISSQKLLKI